MKKKRKGPQRPAKVRWGFACLLEGGSLYWSLAHTTKREALFAAKGWVGDGRTWVVKYVLESAVEVDVEKKR